jgi:hypothetical protein
VSGAAAVLFVTAVLTVCGTGVLAVLGLARSLAELGRRAGLAPLAGMAWAGVVAAMLATAGSRLGVAGLLALTAATCTAGAARLRLVGGKPEATPRPIRDRLEVVLLLPGLATIGVLGVFVLVVFRVKPLFEYDGWAMWGMKSRAIAVLGSADPDVFASGAYERLHLEYPLLLPALHALPLQTADGFSSNTIVLACLAIGAAGLLAIWALFRERVRPALLLAFVAAIAAMPSFFVQLGTGYADVPLAVFVAAGLGAAARWLVEDHDPWLALATLFLTTAVLTKNEGLLFAAAVYLPLLLVATGRRRRVAASVFAVCLAYAPWRVYVAAHGLGAPDYDLSSSLNIPWVLGRLDRAPVAAGGLLERALDPRQFGLLLLLGFAAAVLSAALGPRRLGLLAGGFGLLSLAGLTWIYVLTPNEVSAYLSTNGNRVVMSLVVGLAAVCPLVVEDAVQALSARRATNGFVGGPR